MIQLQIGFCSLKKKYFGDKRYMMENLLSANIQVCCHRWQFGFHGQPTDVLGHYEIGL
jgi:hypothetical protein